MGDYYYGRARACWICKFFIARDSTYTNGPMGICVRHAPDKKDETDGAGMGAPAGFEMFPNVFDAGNGFCGDFVPADKGFMPTETPPTFVLPDPG